VKRELYWVPGSNGIWYLRTAIPGDLHHRDMTVGYVERLPVYDGRPYRGNYYSTPRGSVTASVWEMFDTVAHAQAWVYSLAVLEN
jgi:hypothetical protein